MPVRPLPARLALAALAVTPALAGCGSGAEPAPPAAAAFLAPSREALWVARGPELLRIDPASGDVVWRRRVTATPPGGADDLVAVAASGGGAWVAWRGGAARVPGPTGRVVRIPIAPRSDLATLATVDERTWLAAGTTVTRIRPDGRTGPAIAFPERVSIAPAAGAVLVVAGRRPVLIDPATGRRVSGAAVPAPSPWRMDAAAQTVSRTGRGARATVGVPGITGVTGSPDGGAYATAGDGNREIVRVTPDGRVAWRIRLPG